MPRPVDKEPAPVEVERVLAALHSAGRDVFVRMHFAILLACAVVLAWISPGSQSFHTWSEHLVPGLLLALLLVQLIGGPNSEDREERKFWGDIGNALSLLLTITLVELLVEMFASPAPGNRPGIGPTVAADLAYCLFFVVLLLSAERKVHRPAAWRPPASERWIRLPAGIFFVFGLAYYLVILPDLRIQPAVEGSGGGSPSPFATPETVGDALPSYLLFVVLGLFLGSRFAILTATTPSLRWRAIYLAFGLAILLTALTGLAQAAGGADLLQPSASVPGSIWAAWLLAISRWLPFMGGAVALAIRSVPFAPRAPTKPFRSARLGPVGAGAGGMIVLWALIFPTLHVVLNRLGLLDPALVDAREKVVMVAVAVLGLAAFLEQRYQEARAMRLWQEQTSFEHNLRASEKDLRLMVERQRTRGELRRSEEKFSKAFAASPDGLAISSLETGTILEMNSSFVELFGLDRDRFEGHAGKGISLWPSPEVREEAVRRLRREGAIRDLGLRLPRPDGGHLWVQVSFEILQLGPEPLLLTVLRDRTGLEEHDDAGDLQGRILDRAEVSRWATGAIYGEDSTGTITFWNGGAETLFGLSEQAAIGKTSTEAVSGARAGCQSWRIPTHTPSGPGAIMLSARVDTAHRGRSHAPEGG